MVVESINSIIYGGLTNYFTRLSYEGYCEYFKVYKLLSLIFINRILDGYYGFIVNTPEFNELIGLIYKVTGNCLTKYPMEETKDGLFITSTVFASLRISDSDILRTSEEDLLRKVI